FLSGSDTWPKRSTFAIASITLSAKKPFRSESVTSENLDSVCIFSSPFRQDTASERAGNRPNRRECPNAVYPCTSVGGPLTRKVYVYAPGAFRIAAKKECRRWHEGITPLTKFYCKVSF